MVLSLVFLNNAETNPRFISGKLRFLCLLKLFAQRFRLLLLVPVLTLNVQALLGDLLNQFACFF